MQNLLDNAMDGKYSDFKNEIFMQMASRMQNDPIIAEYNRRMEYYESANKCLETIPSLNDFKD